MNIPSLFQLTALTIALSVLLYSCGCTSYKDEFEYLPNHTDFVSGNSEISFQNGEGEMVTLSVGEVICGMGDPEDFCEPQCSRTSYEICGQGITRSVDEAFALDFSHSKKAWHDENFYFTDSYFNDSMTTRIEFIDSIEVASHMFYSVMKIKPKPISVNSSIAEFYYVDQTGPIRYLFATGEIWNRIP